MIFSDFVFEEGVPPFFDRRAVGGRGPISENLDFSKPR